MPLGPDRRFPGGRSDAERSGGGQRRQLAQASGPPWWRPICVFAAAGVLLADGFESGDLAAWPAAVP